MKEQIETVVPRIKFVAEDRDKAHRRQLYIVSSVVHKPKKHFANKETL